MTIRINNITLSIDDDMSLIKTKACKKIKVAESNIKSFKILKESIDARKKDNIKFNYCVELNCDNEEKIVKRAKELTA